MYFYNVFSLRCWRTEKWCSFLYKCGNNSNKYSMHPNRPTQLPFPATPKNIPKLEEYIKEHFTASVFNNSSPFPSLTGQPAKIHLKSNTVPHARHCPIPMPHYRKAEVKKSLYRDVERGIIAPVAIGTPVTWCSPMVVVSKPDRTPRRTIDFQHLNAQSLRETHHTSSPFQLASQIPPNTKSQSLMLLTASILLSLMLTVNH